MSHSRSARTAVSLASLAAVSLGLAWSPPGADAEGSAATTVKVQFIGRSPSGSNLSEPAVSVGVTNGSLIAWAQYGAVGDLVLDYVTDDKVKRIGLPLGGLTTFGKPDIRYGNPQVEPWFLALASNASGADLAATLGTYIWTADDLEKLTQHKVWDSFGLPDLASDGHGGFWLITGQTGVQVVHVPASLAMQTYPDDQIELSDRISSRLEMGLEAIAKPFTLLTAFDSAKGVWVHVGTTPGKSHDLRVFKTGAYFQGLSANREEALIIGTHPASYTNGGDPHLYGRYLTVRASGSVKMTPEFLISKEYVTDASVTASGFSHEVSWLTYTDQIFKATSSVKQHVTSTRLGLQFPSGQWNNPATPRYLPDSGWFAFAYDGQSRQSFVRIPRCRRTARGAVRECWFRASKPTLTHRHPGGRAVSR